MSGYRGKRGKYLKLWDRRFRLAVTKGGEILENGPCWPCHLLPWRCPRVFVNKTVGSLTSHQSPRWARWLSQVSTSPKHEKSSFHAGHFPLCCLLLSSKQTPGPGLSAALSSSPVWVTASLCLTKWHLFSFQDQWFLYIWWISALEALQCCDKIESQNAFRVCNITNSNKKK